MQFGIEYIVESRENLQNFICGVIIGIDDNLFLGAVTATAKLVGTVKGELPEDNYSFMLGKVITDVMFIAFFNASSIQSFYNGMMFTSAALSSAGAGAVLFIPTAGGSALVAVPVSVASINVAAASFTVAIVAEAGAMHSQSLLNDDQSKLKKAKRDKGAADTDNWLVGKDGTVNSKSKPNFGHTF